jgi:hypothetical protein
MGAIDQYPDRLGSVLAAASSVTAGLAVSIALIYFLGLLGCGTEFTVHLPLIGSKP